MSIDEASIEEIASGKLIAIKRVSDLNYELLFLIGGRHYTAFCVVNGGFEKIPVVQSEQHDWIFSVGPIRWVSGVVIAIARVNQEIPP